MRRDVAVVAAASGDVVVVRLSKPGGADPSSLLLRGEPVGGGIRRGSSGPAITTLVPCVFQSR